ncbi:sigma-54-dependent Fis family transcriptional regulator [candidate division KSB1 bacterium]|nr:sigma-54-dependent Fis family transcriptional regulator [candidate division KSB1 bacterium]
MSNILVVDDLKSTTDAVAQIVTARAHQAFCSATAEDAFAVFKHTPIDVIITDMKLPEKSGLDLLRQVREIDADVPIIVMTAFGTVKNAVDAMKWGAFDYLTKPVSLEELEVKLDKALQQRNLALKNQKLRLENDYLREEVHQHFSQIIGRSQEMQRIYSLVKRVASANSPVLILGESGTGKELIAHAIHNNSERKEKPFIKVNCAALAENLLESELFGHEKGAFTNAIRQKPGRFEIAANGTIFLDEIGEISPALQVKLLRVLQEKEFERVGGTDTLPMNARIIAATNLDLEQEIRNKNFREDLYYRLNVVSIHLPPLHQRADDIPELINHFIRKYSEETGKNIDGITPQATKCLLNYSWPGNIRELENIIERAIVLTATTQIDVDDLPAHLMQSFDENLLTELAEDDLTKNIEEHEKKLIFKALLETKGNISRAAARLNIKRTTLRYKMEKYDFLRYKFE